MQRGLISQRAGDDGLRVVCFDVQAAEPGSPPAVEDAVDAEAACWYLPRWLDWSPHLQMEPPEAPSCDEPVAARAPSPA